MPSCVVGWLLAVVNSEKKWRIRGGRGRWRRVGFGDLLDVFFLLAVTMTMYWCCCGCFVFGLLGLRMWRRVAVTVVGREAEPFGGGGRLPSFGKVEWMGGGVSKRDDDDSCKNRGQQKKVMATKFDLRVLNFSYLNNIF